MDRPAWRLELGHAFDLLKGTIRGRRPTVHWLDRWDPAVDQMLRALPALELCPPDLMREIFEVCTVAKRIAMVYDGEDPLAVVPLKSSGGAWRPLTTWILPGTLFPVRCGDWVRALAALQMPVFVGWWRQNEPPPLDSAICHRRDVPAHRLACVEEDEAYWRKTGSLNKIRRARKRCAALRVEVNRSNAAQWTLENWGTLWAAGEHDRIPDTPERLVVARYWEPRGRHVTVSLMDGDEFAASATVFVQDRDVIGLTNYRRREYDTLMIGTRMFDAVHQWALASGMATIDFGSDYDYKKDWAPASGFKSELIIETPPSAPARTLRAVKAMLKTTLARAG